MPARQGVRPAIDALRARLAGALELGRAAGWGEPRAMTAALEDVRRRHDNAAGRPVAADRISRAVAAFRRRSKVADLAQLRYVCLGAATLDAEGRCLLAEPALRARLFDLAETVPGARRQLKCFQALLRGYWSFPRYQEAPAAAIGMEALRGWLARRYGQLLSGGGGRPTWFTLLGRHLNLLGESPCERYGPALLRGDAGELQAVIDGLAIPADSWVKQEAVLAQAKAAAALPDSEWLAVLPQLLDIAAGKAGVEVSARLAQRCVALYLSRHARCETVGRHEALLDAAIAAIGNPWQRRPAWDAQVLDAQGKPDELAREMVNGWLKDWLIAQFFRLHSADADDRRAAYWQRYAPFITSLWIGLDSKAMERRDNRQGRFVRRSAGCLLLTDAAGDDEAALLLRIDDVLAVEFGDSGRGLQLFRWSGLEGKLQRRLGSAREAKYFSLSALLAGEPEARLAHADEADAPWEARFDQRLRPLLLRR
ncbi:MAG TPA: EH signature domain-containing protein [Rhodocyclaceae bacterium]